MLQGLGSALPLPVKEGAKREGANKECGGNSLDGKALALMSHWSYLLHPDVMLDGWVTVLVVSGVLGWWVRKWDREREIRREKRAAARELERATRVAARDISHNLRALGVYDWEKRHGPAAAFWSGVIPSTELFSLYAPVIIDRKQDLVEPLLLLHRWIVAAQRKRDLDDDDREAIKNSAKSVLDGLGVKYGPIDDTFSKDYGK
jgi:hypothetical protein